MPLSNSDKETVQQLLEKSRLKSATRDELRQLFEIFGANTEEDLQAIVDEQYEVYTNNTDSADVTAEDREEIFQHIVTQPQLMRRTKVRKLWLKYAAAASIIMAIAGGYYYIKSHREAADPGLAQTNRVPLQNDVAPGSNRATLRLANGENILLDSVAIGEIARQRRTTITKNADGTIAYKALNAIDPESVQFNMLITPRGGQYHLVLPDGSEVWLNSESSIRFPTVFINDIREVTITGEAYFEVAKHAGKKFIVHVSPQGGGNTDAPLAVEVLGTQFNINAYPEKENIATTLLEGKVRLTHDSRLTTHDAVHTTLDLTPGQQGLLTANELSDRKRLTLAANPDIEQVMAWKNGMFLMSNTNLETIMYQVSRWYDVNVVYDAPPTKEERYGGGISRNLPLSEILDLLKNSGVQFRLEGKTLHVRP